MPERLFRNRRNFLLLFGAVMLLAVLLFAWPDRKVARESGVRRLPAPAMPARQVRQPRPPGVSDCSPASPDSDGKESPEKPEVANQKGPLLVQIKGITSTNGTIVCALYGSAATFTQRRRPTAATRLTPQTDGCRWRLESLAAGRYAIAVFHDENGNGKLDRENLLDIPTEPYGFSRNARGSFGPPSYEAAAFTYDGSELKQLITIQSLLP